mgnify:CR=1 FL=1
MELHNRYWQKQIGSYNYKRKGQWILCVGLCALLGGFFVTSNRESGEGRYDIQLKPVKKGLPGIIIELRAEKEWKLQWGNITS